MHAGRRFSLLTVLRWTRRELLIFLLLATVPTVLYAVLGWRWLSIPWLPVALIGTAVAFLIGFKNNASYGRLWEARMIWGAIVNDSRTWGIYVRDFIDGSRDAGAEEADAPSAVHRRLIRRHVAWLTALRYQLRQPKAWESMERDHAKEYLKVYRVPEWETKLDDELAAYLSPDELTYVLGKKNRATQIVALQSRELKGLRAADRIAAFPYVQLARLLEHFYTHQGKAERIKNFPYPRQFATFNLYFVWLFIFLVPLGMLHEVDDKLGAGMVWMTIPFSVLVAWVFHTMEKIGEATENPFEGGANDIPMAALSRTIEIDLLDLLDEPTLPAPVAAVNDILM